MNAKLSNRIRKSLSLSFTVLLLAVSASHLAAAPVTGPVATEPASGSPLAGCTVVRSWAEGDLESGFRLHAELRCTAELEWMFVGLKGRGITNEPPRSWADERSTEQYVGGRSARDVGPDAPVVASRLFTPHASHLTGLGAGDVVAYTLTLRDEADGWREIEVEVPVRAQVADGPQN